MLFERALEKFFAASYIPLNLFSYFYTKKKKKKIIEYEYACHMSPCTTDSLITPQLLLRRDREKKKAPDESNIEWRMKEETVDARTTGSPH